MASLLHIALLFLAISIAPGLHGQVSAREQRALDSLYVRDFSDRPAIRLYISSKFNNLVARSLGTFPNIRYQPNGHYNIGVGLSYRRLTLNIGVPMPFVDNEVAAKGRTRFLDAQATLHTNKQSSNLFLQIFKGYHITSHTLDQVGWSQTTAYPYRSDLRQFNIGLSSLRIVDHEHFSYRATFNQDAWQQRTRGTWLFGGYATCYVLNADSSVVPVGLRAQFDPSAAIDQGLFMDLGPMGGYAHTFVHRSHWFLTVSGAGGVGPSVQRIRSSGAEGNSTRVDFGPGWHMQVRAGIGYNSRYHFAGILYNQARIGYLLRDQDRFAWDVGNFRIMVVKRLKAKSKGLDRGFRWLKKNTPLPLQ